MPAVNPKNTRIKITERVGRTSKRSCKHHRGKHTEIERDTARAIARGWPARENEALVSRSAEEGSS